MAPEIGVGGDVPSHEQRIACDTRVMLLEPGKELESAPVVEPNIDDRPIEGVLCTGSARLGETACGVNLYSMERERVLNHAPHRDFVIDEQYDWHHVHPVKRGVEDSVGTSHVKYVTREVTRVTRGVCGLLLRITKDATSRPC